MPAELQDGVVKFAHLGFHVAHACNLSCEGCSHFSNHHFGGILSLEDIQQQVEPWRSRLQPRDLVMAGGEPTLNRSLPEIVRYAGECFPNSQLEIITNGFYLLERGEPLLRACLDTRTLIKISVHHMSAAYTQALRPIRLALKDWTARGARIEYTLSIARWTQRYKGFGAQLEPFDDKDPDSSFRICSHRYTAGELSFQLHQGKLWKCPPLAYLPMMEAKYGLLPVWDQYLDYSPLTPISTPEQIVDFLNIQTERHCGMCPAYRRPLEINNPMERNRDTVA